MRIAVVIPCYKVRAHVLDVLIGIGAEVERIYVVDDACPEQSGDFVAKNCTDARVVLLKNSTNMGVGGAVMAGYRRAIADSMDVIVKIDGDGQMDPALLPVFVAPIVAGEADYTKGNRFFDLTSLGQMPLARLFGNAALSFMAKLSTGYWSTFDPTNGYTAIAASVAARLPLDKLSTRYFFETDILFRLNAMRAVVEDVPMDARYGNEVSSLAIWRIIGEFLFKHTRNFAKRVLYTYYLRDFSLGSIELPVGLLLSAFGVSTGIYHWFHSWQLGETTPPGTVMLAALPTLLGLQFIMAWFVQDIASVPRRPLQKFLRLRQPK